MIPNCLKEIDLSIEREKASTSHIMELVGSQLSSINNFNCNTCELVDRCKMKPINGKGEFIGVRLEI